MKRREKLRTTAVLGAGTLTRQNIIESGSFTFLPQPEENNPYLTKRFGDTRDWFLKSTSKGLFITSSKKDKREYQLDKIFYPIKTA